MQEVTFVVNLIIFFVSAFVLCNCTIKAKQKIFERIKGNSFKIICGSTALSFILFILDIAGILDFGGYHLLSLCNTLFGAFIILFLLFRKKIPEKFEKLVNFSIRSLTVCLVLELFVFNFNSTHLFLGDYPEKTLDLSTAVTENFDLSSGNNIESGRSSIEFKGLNTPVGTVSFEALSNKKGYVDISIDMSDDSHSASYRDGIASAEVIKGNKRSQTIPCNFSGNVHDIRFSFNTDEGEIITLTKIEINNPIMLRFSLTRFLVLFLGSLIIYLLAMSEFSKRSYDENKRYVKAAVWIFTVALVIPALILANTLRYTDENHSIKKDFQSESGNQISQEIVDAFAHGKTSLDIEMNEALEALENPYDGSQREVGEIGSYPWDHLYFNGKYYSYYGIGPVLTLFLPYYLITGYYFPSIWAIFLFGFIGIIFLTKFYLCFIEKFFKKINSSLVLMGCVIMQLSSGIWFCFNYPNFYEIAQTSGFVCITVGAYFMMSSNVIGDGKIKNWRLAMSTAFLSLAVLCRPTTAVYCIASLLLIFAGFKKKRELQPEIKKSIGKYYLPYFLCALIPFVAIGSIQVIYNYVRFKNPLDFGIQYSLTINDFTSSQFHTHFAAIGFFDYLFVIPKFQENFPFLVSGDLQTFAPQGYYFIATFSAIGLIWKALPILSYGKFRKAYRLSENKNKKLYTLIILAVCIVCPFAIIASIWESGYGSRYCVDFAWQIIIGALVIAFIVYQNSMKNTREHLKKLMVLSMVICIILNFGQTYEWISPKTALSQSWQAGALSFARVFEFWR